jgi:hypothetical protein
VFSFLFLDYSLAVNVNAGTVTSTVYGDLVTAMCTLVENSTDAATFFANTQGYDVYIGTHEGGAAFASDVANNEVFSVVVGFKNSNTSC